MLHMCSPSSRAVASLVVLSFPDLQVVYESYSLVTLDLPYMSGALPVHPPPLCLQWCFTWPTCMALLTRSRSLSGDSSCFVPFDTVC